MAQGVELVAGRSFEPTEEQRRKVRAMAGFGVPDEDIAILIEVDLGTLRRHFMHDLGRGAAEGTARIAQTLFQVATVDRNVAALIFWLKSRAGWSERHQVQVVSSPLESISTRDLTWMIEHLRGEAAIDADLAGEPATQKD